VAERPCARVRAISLEPAASEPGAIVYRRHGGSAQQTRWWLRRVSTVPDLNPSHVWFGSKADIEAPRSEVRFTPKADIQQRGLDVRFVPKADIASLTVGARHYRFHTAV
jgi:hypothetical protein